MSESFADLMARLNGVEEQKMCELCGCCKSEFTRFGPTYPPGGVDLCSWCGEYLDQQGGWRGVSL